MYANKIGSCFILYILFYKTLNIIRARQTNSRNKNRGLFKRQLTYNETLTSWLKQYYKLVIKKEMFKEKY